MIYGYALPSILHLPVKPVRGFEAETAELAARRRDAEGAPAHDAIRSSRRAIKGRTIEREPLFLTAQADGD